ncbi:hypothetical protein F4804DRAFT_320918, partial [Jackrogersella minutella]
MKTMLATIQEVHENPFLLQRHQLPRLSQPPQRRQLQGVEVQEVEEEEGCLLDCADQNSLALSLITYNYVNASFVWIFSIDAYSLILFKVLFLTDVYSYLLLAWIVVKYYCLCMVFC